VTTKARDEVATAAGAGAVEALVTAQHGDARPEQRPPPLLARLYSNPSLAHLVEEDREVTAEERASTP
jgi:hypothetical protein